MTTIISADDSTLVAATGHYYLAPTGTARPTNPKAPGSAWTDAGDTSLDAPFGFTFDGGDDTVLGTWQNPAKRVTHAPLTISVAFTLLNWTIDSLKLYWGGNGNTVAGRFRVPVSPTESTMALFILIQDGLEEVGIYFPSVSIYRADDISGDATSFAGLPVRATVLGVTGNDWLFEIDPKTDLDVASIANAPSTSSKAVGQTTQLVVTATLTDATTRDVTAIATYTTSDATKATVNAAGLVTFVATGSATITANYGEKTSTTA
ncbi:MAG: hypothetical protein JWM93_94, partial [Frankiales bacterium]|nr:hypothetical protein [Frankiales bacterium]